MSRISSLSIWKRISSKEMPRSAFNLSFFSLSHVICFTIENISQCVPVVNYYCRNAVASSIGGASSVFYFIPQCSKRQGTEAPTFALHSHGAPLRGAFSLKSREGFQECTIVHSRLPHAAPKKCLRSGLREGTPWDSAI